MSKSLYTTNNQGEIVFAETDNRRHSYKPDSFFSSLPFQLLILVVCGATDFASFNQMFAITLYDVEAMRWLAVIGLLVAFDLIPVVAANNIKKRVSGCPSSSILSAGLIVTFFCAVALNLCLRYMTRDTVFPNLDGYTRSMFGGGETAASTANPNAAALAVFFGLLPVFTSVVSFSCAYMLFDPLGNIKRNLEKSYALLTNEVNRYAAIIKEYTADADFRERTLRGDDVQYETAQARIAGQSRYLKDYTRQRIKEHLLTPVALSELSAVSEIEHRPAEQAEPHIVRAIRNRRES